MHQEAGLAMRFEAKCKNTNSRTIGCFCLKKFTVYIHWYLTVNEKEKE